MALAKLSNTSAMISASPNCRISTCGGSRLTAGWAIICSPAFPRGVSPARSAMTTRTHAVELLELDVGMYAPEVGDLLGHLGGHHGVACSFGARDGEGNDGPAVERGEGARFGDAVADL